MTADRTTRSIVRRWLDDGVTELPDRVLDAVLDQLPATPQRRRRLLGRWTPRPHRFALPAAAAAVLVVVAIAGTLTVPGGVPPGGAPPPSSATSYPILPDGWEKLHALRYRVPEAFGVPLSVEVEDGWESCSAGPREIGLCRSASVLTPSVAISVVETVLADPCDFSSGRAPGPGVDDVVEAISALPGFTATEPESVVVDGHPGRRFTVTAPTRAPSDCPDGLGTWAAPERVNGVGAGEINELTVVEVDGVHVLIALAYRPGTSPDRFAGVRRMIASIQFDE